MRKWRVFAVSPSLARLLRGGCARIASLKLARQQGANGQVARGSGDFGQSVGITRGATRGGWWGALKAGLVRSLIPPAL